MSTDSILYREIYKYTRDQIAKLIFSATTVVLAFGVTLIGINISGEKIVPWNYNGLIRGSALTVIFVFLWFVYFRVLFRMERDMKHSVNSMYENETISKDELEFSMSNYDPRIKFIPFVVSFVLYLAVMAPL